MKKESPCISKHLYISLSISLSLPPKLPTIAGLKALSPVVCQRRQCGTKPTLHYQDNLNWIHSPSSMEEENKHLGCILSMSY